MTASAEPQALLSPLPRADGSATYSHAGYTVTASVNGPLEAGRRDEDPYEAVVDVVVRPVAGTGGTRERHLEALLEGTLRQLILLKNFPRGMIQVVLQVEAVPANDYMDTKLVQSQVNLAIIPALVQAAVLALLSAAVPLRRTAAATIVAVVPGMDLVVDPSPRQLEDAQSVHVLAFTSSDELLLAESGGDFSMDDWARVHQLAHRICCGPDRTGTALEEDTMQVDLSSGTGPDLRHFIRATTEAKVSEDLGWKNEA